jgi:hypothetical protein
MEFAHWRVSTLEAARRLLASGRLTPVGHWFFKPASDVNAG